MLGLRLRLFAGAQGGRMVFEASRPWPAPQGNQEVVQHTGFAQVTIQAAEGNRGKGHDPTPVDSMGHWPGQLFETYRGISGKFR